PRTRCRRWSRASTRAAAWSGWWTARPRAGSRTTPRASSAAPSCARSATSGDGAPRRPAIPARRPEAAVSAALRILPLALGPFETNTYILACLATGDCAVVDVGFDPEAVARRLERERLPPRLIL